MQRWTTSEKVMGGWLPFLVEDKDDGRQPEPFRPKPEGPFAQPSPSAPLFGVRMPL